LNLVPCPFAETVTLVWNTNSEPNISGYWVYVGTASRQYGKPIDVGKTNQYVVPKLQMGVIYYFAVTAKNTAALESNFSNEVSTTVTNALAVLSFSQGTVEARGAAQKTYSIEATRDLTNWISLTSGMTDTNGVFSYADPQFRGFPFRFYRARE
jgi:fibronectin type 3 domain-containing protein